MKVRAGEMARQQYYFPALIVVSLRNVQYHRENREIARKFILTHS